jgi:Domain of unknown function (DUF1848)
MPPKLISASRRTDIPAFYGEWLRRRIDAGWCETKNPFSGQTYRVSLAPDDVLGWVFWSRNYAPFLETLDAIHAADGRFLCHFTITGYPRELDARTPAADVACDTARLIVERFGSEVLQWRYDPILLTSLTPPDWHRKNFARLAQRLDGVAKRCIFSFPTMYKKTVRNLQLGGTDGALRVWSEGAGDFDEGLLAELARDLAQIAADHGIEMQTCCDGRWIDPSAGITQAHCADWPLLRGLLPNAGDINVPRNPTRKQCGCYKSTDIGAYQTCAHGCLYCYAVDDPLRARENLTRHQPESPRL